MVVVDVMPLRVVLARLYQGTLIGTPKADWYCTRVYRFVRDTSEGRFDRGVPGYTNWFGGVTYQSHIFLNSCY